MSTEKDEQETSHQFNLQRGRHIGNTAKLSHPQRATCSTQSFQWCRKQSHKSIKNAFSKAKLSNIWPHA